ncbi:MAG: hypothetical protein ACYTFK_14050 [Planctomycetota bacterium]|jgi:hypothetical protein
MTLDELNIAIDRLDSKIQEHQDAIKLLAEQRSPLSKTRRKLIEASHGLNEGDKLLGTTEFAQNIDKRGWSKRDLNGWRQGDILTFNRITGENICAINGMHGGTSGLFPLQMVKDMRAAYLDKYVKEVNEDG